MKEFSTEVTIDAPARRVWSVLTDFERYPEWNPFLRRVEGPLEEGARLEVRIEPPGGSGMTFRPRLIRVDPERELRWLGQLWQPGICDGEHVFDLRPRDEDTVHLVHAETFRGLLAPLLWRTMGPKTYRGFLAMNEALKQRCEGDE